MIFERMNPGRWFRFRPFLGGVFFLGGALLPSLRAEDVSSDTVLSLSTASLTCDFMEYRSSDNVVIARGHAVAVSSGTQLAADEMTLYLSSQVVVAQGHSVLISSGTRLEADELTLFQSSREAVARGHIFLQDQELSILAENLQYNWDDSTGEFENIFIQQGLWRTWGRRLVRLSPTHYRIERAAFTSCELNPPHYHFRGGTANFWVRHRMSAVHLRSAAEKTPFLYTPYYTRSLKDNSWTFTVRPGNSERNGYFAKSVFTYPVTPHSQAKLLWDYYSLAGNGFGAEYTYSTTTVRGSVSYYRIEDKIDDRKRWDLRYAHWQQLAPRWQVQSHVAMQSDQDVNNIFLGDDYQRARQLGESDLAFTRNGSWYTSRIFVQHDRALDSVNSRYVTSLTILPQLGFQSSALRLGKSNAYFNFGGNFRNEYDRPEANPPNTDPIVPGLDHYRQYADGAAALTWRLPLTKNLSLEPGVGLSESWQSQQQKGNELDPANLMQGAGSTGVNLRHRLTRDLDYDFGYRTKVRWTPNTFRRDHAAADQGMEQNMLNLFANYRPSSAVWGRASTTYDLRDSPSSQNTALPLYETPRQRFSPPSFEMGVRPRRWFSLSGRETVQVFPVTKPQSSVLDVRFGADDTSFFSAGFSYNNFRPGALDLVNGVAFQLTRGWWLSGDVHYTATGTGGMQYNAIDFKEKNLVIRRNLHCWVVRVTYKERPGVHEVLFRFDLKTDLDGRSNKTTVDEKQFYPARDTRGD
ncbi:MAG: LPS-assembly protein LptD [Elusimicrobia bacterium]|nr:LPS-assembly protein LptD [Elusimicrobiota bacterium]